MSGPERRPETALHHPHAVENHNGSKDAINCLVELGILGNMIVHLSRSQLSGGTGRRELGILTEMNAARLKSPAPRRDEKMIERVYEKLANITRHVV